MTLLEAFPFYSVVVACIEVTLFRRKAGELAKVSRRCLPDGLAAYHVSGPCGKAVEVCV